MMHKHHKEPVTTLNMRLHEISKTSREGNSAQNLLTSCRLFQVHIEILTSIVFQCE